MSDGDVSFFWVSFLPIFLELGIKRRQFFWSQLSKHVRNGNLVILGYYLVPVFVLGVYFSPIFPSIGYPLKAKFWSWVKKKFFVGISPYKFRSSTPPGLNKHRRQKAE